MVAPFNWGTGGACLLVRDPKWGFSGDRPDLARSSFFNAVQYGLLLYIIIVE